MALPHSSPPTRRTAAASPRSPATSRRRRAHQVVALHPVSGPAVYPSVVRHRIRRDSHGDYLAAAAALNASDVEVVSIQHEYGIWGGEDGAFVLDFVRALACPS